MTQRGASLSHREAAHRQLERKGRLNTQFAQKAKTAGGVATLESKELMMVLICVATTGENKRGEGRTSQLARSLWRDTFQTLWYGAETSHGKWSEETFRNLLEGKNPRPFGGDWHPLLKALLAECALALDIDQMNYADFERFADQPFSSCSEFLDAYLDYCFDGQGVTLKPKFDQNLAVLPFWEDPGWDGPIPRAAKKVEEVEKLLKSDKGRVVFVVGETFSAKGEVLKAIIQRNRDGYTELENGKRIPIFAQSIHSISPSDFIDLVFKFLLQNDMGGQLELGQLSEDAKISIIENAAKRTPALYIISGAEQVFYQDTIMRRLRGDVIGDVLSSVLRGNSDTRLLASVNQDSETKLWPGSECIELPPSREEYQMAFARLPQADQAVLKGADDFSGVTLRVAMPLIKTAAEVGKFPFNPAILEQGLRDNSPKYVFNLAWTHTLDCVDRLILGLVATSQDGLQIETLLRLLSCLETIDPSYENICVGARTLISGSETEEWFKKHSWLVKSRSSNQNRESLFIRDSIRQLVLEAFKRTNPLLARDVYWCIAREASQQARQALLHGGQGLVELALVRNLQALDALLHSIDNEQLFDRMGGGTLTTEFATSRVLPPSDRRARRPSALLAFRYAWCQLYKLDIEGGRNQLLNVYDDPNALLDTLLRFLTNETPWIPAFEQELCNNSDGPIGLSALGPALKALTPMEQAELLVGISVAALRAGKFHIVRDAAAIGRLLQKKYSRSIPAHLLCRLFTAEVDLGILCGGNPDARFINIFCPTDFSTNTAHPPADYELEGVADHIERLLSSLPMAGAEYHDNDSRIVARAKLEMRRAEVLFLMDEKKKARQAVRRALRERKNLRNREFGASPIPIIIGGRSSRLIVRSCINLANDGKFDEIEFSSDGFRWPTPKKAKSKGNVWLKLAMDAVELNAAQLARGQWSNRIGVLVDQARLLTGQWEFEQADQKIKRALRLVEKGRGAGSEVLFELAQLRAALDLEMAMRLKDPWIVENDDELLSQWRHSISELSEAVNSFPDLLREDRLRIFHLENEQLRGQLHILRSRIEPPDSKERLCELKAAKRKLQDTLHQMESVQLRQPIPRIKETLRRIDLMVQPTQKVPEPV